MLGIICGSNFAESRLFKDAQERLIPSEWGKSRIFLSKGTAYCLRHGKNEFPAHMVPHEANILALEQVGCKKLVGLCSAGSLKAEISPGTIVVPSDFICLHEPRTFFDDKVQYTVPKIDEKLAQKIAETAEKIGLRVKRGGTYFQTAGPRFETKAEIRLFANFADVVGMTMATEATLCSEKGIPYASACIVDNYANGVVGKETHWKEKEISIKEVEKVQKENKPKMEALAKALSSELK